MKSITPGGYSVGAFTGRALNADPAPTNGLNFHGFYLYDNIGNTVFNKRHGAHAVRDFHRQDMIYRQRPPTTFM
jgi:hypothetical protein